MYLPIQPPVRQAIGVYEIYQDAAPIEAQIDHDVRESC